MNALQEYFLPGRAGEMAFDVPLHDLMLLRIPGKQPNTVLTVERQIYTWRIAEYTEPLAYGRHWCYEDMGECLLALEVYLSLEEETEPGGWIRAIDFEHGYRVRRWRVIDGEPQIVDTSDEG